MRHQLVIVGGGPAGLTAGLYAARARLDVVLLESSAPGGQMLKTYQVDNWPGDMNGVNGYDLAVRMHEHALRFGLRVETASLEALDYGAHTKGMRLLRTSYGEISAKAVILACGAYPHTLGIPGEDAFTGKGVSYCATCDAPFYRGQKVAVIGGGDAAVEEALYLTRFAREVTLIHRRDQLRASPVLQEEMGKSQVKLLLSTVPVEVLGNKQVEGLVVKNLKTGAQTALEAQGVFIFVGTDPQTAFAAPGLNKTSQGFILTDQNLCTSLPGVFAAGDCRESPLKQIVIAAGEGALAAYMAQKFLETEFLEIK
jgi:thioredoxin reductase (NADPH)